MAATSLYQVPVYNRGLANLQVGDALQDDLSQDEEPSNFQVGLRPNQGLFCQPAPPPPKKKYSPRGLHSDPSCYCQFLLIMPPFV
jgi:hypothetical protein